MFAPAAVKGNTKGLRKSHQTRKALMLCGAMFTVLACIHVMLSYATGTNPLNERQMQMIRTKQDQFNGMVEKRFHHHHDEGEDSGTSEDSENEENEENEEEEEAVEEAEDIGPVKEVTVYDFPSLKYSTKDKGESTAFAVEKAIHMGFRHFDTDCENKEYHEQAVGKAWSRAAEDLSLDRSEFFLQTKFTNKEHQDPESDMPYDPDAGIEVQVVQSIEASLRNLRTDYIDSYILHFPEPNWERTFKVWGIMEQYMKLGKIKQLGISHCWDAEFLKYFYSQVTIKPKVVQQKLFKDTQYVFGMRRFAHNKDIEFQHFEALSANQHVLENQKIIELAEEKGLTPETLTLAFYLSVGLSPLVGTSSEEHMMRDMDIYNRIITNGEAIFNNEEQNEIQMIANQFPIDLKYD